MGGSESNVKTKCPYITKGLVASAFLVLFTLQSAFGQAITIPQDPSKFHIFLMMGQSNMVGAWSNDGPRDIDTDPRILQFDPVLGWKLAKDPVANGQTIGTNPGLAFAKKLAGENEEITIGLVPLAVGGTHLYQWSKGGEYYGPTLQAAASVRKYGVIKGILWHQGEHDGIFQSEAETYGPRLAKFEDDLRKDLGVVELPFITGGLSSGIIHTNHYWAPLVWDQIKSNAKQTYLTGYATSSDLSFMPSDPLHFTTASQRFLGQRYCEEYLRLSGYWTQKAKEKLDAEAEVMEGGWKYHPSLGLYWDANFPIVKQAQLGWVVLSYNEDGGYTMHSKFFGDLRAQPVQTNHALYLYRENPDPEMRYLPGTFYFVNLLANENTQHVIYNHTTLTWSRTIDDAPDLITIGALYSAAETVFGMTQNTSTQTINAAYMSDWGEVTKKLHETEENRLLTILYAQDAYWFAHRNLTGNQARFWKEHSLDLLSRIDAYLIDAQVQYEYFVNRL